MISPKNKSTKGLRKVKDLLLYKSLDYVLGKKRFSVRLLYQLMSQRIKRRYRQRCDVSYVDMSRVRLNFFFIKNSNTKSLLYSIQYIFPTSDARHSSVFFLATNKQTIIIIIDRYDIPRGLSKNYLDYHIKILCCAIYYKTLTCRRNVDGSYLRE